MKLPKINLGKSTEKRSLFDLSHDVSSTFNFGEVQPLMCRELVPQSTLDVSVDSFVRLAPMPLPTFGRLTYRTYHQFVPIADLYKPFENLLSGIRYNSATESYIPTQVPNLEAVSFIAMVLSRGYYYSIWKGDMFGQGADARATNVVCTGTTTTSTMLKTILKVHFQNASYVDSITDYAMTDAHGKYESHSSATGTLGHPVTIEGADMVISYVDQDNEEVFYLCIKLKSAARRLRKILLGLGYQVGNTESHSLSVLPLFAYYKAWFDIFGPQRNTSWTDTNAFKLLDNFAETGVVFIDQYLDDSEELFDTLDGFIEDLTKCFYYGDNDFISIHTPNVINSPTQSATENGPVAYEQTNTTVSSKLPVDSVPYVDLTLNNKLTGLKMELAQKLYKWANKNSVIGGKISDYLRVHFGADFLQNVDSNYIGSDVINIQIGDVMATSDTAQTVDGQKTGANIGEYAGRGVGYGNGDSLKFTSKTFGYWIILGSIVPNSSYVQGTDPNLHHIGRYEFFTPEYDAVGKQVTPIGSVLGSNVANNTYLPDLYLDTFGFVPRYSEYKTANGVLNGDLSLGSTRDSLLPYTLDRVLTENKMITGDVKQDTTTGLTTYSSVRFHSNMGNLPAAGPAWRSIGEYDWLGNYNRIFYNEGIENGTGREDYYEEAYSPVPSIDDNFIVHNVIQIKATMPMLSMANSFETNDGGDSISVEHA